MSFDPNTLMTTANNLAMILGLIGLWKQERGAAAKERYKDFMQWLDAHHFTELKDRIFSSEELQRELNSLLREDLSNLSTKLDIIGDAVTSVAQKIDGLSSLSKTLNGKSESLSTQACEILKIFADADGCQELVYERHPENALHLSPSGGAFTMSESRFVGSDLESLVALGFLTISDYAQNGDPCFSLTRSGQKFAEQLPPAEFTNGIP